MKKISVVVILLITGMFLVGYYSNMQDTLKPNKFYPAEVKKVVDAKCYGCHSVKGQSDDAKDALMWDSLPGLSRRKVIATLDKIIEVLEDNAMPPEDVIKEYPELKLAATDKSTLMKWADAKADSLLQKR